LAVLDLCGYLRGFCGEDASNDSEWSKRRFFSTFDVFIFGTFTNKANVIIIYYLVPCLLYT